MRTPLAVTVLVLAGVHRSFAPPPLVTGDVPTADKQSFEWYVGGLYQENESGNPLRLLPASELVYGISDRQEVTFEMGGLSTDHHYGVSDAVVGTKYVFLKETELPGISGSFELKLPTGDEDRGLGSGEFDYDFRLRTQKTWGWFTLIGNAGYSIITEPTVGGVQESRDNVWLLSTAQEYELAKRFRLLSEMYWFSREEPGGLNTLAGQIGCEYHLRDGLNVHGAVGKSLREGNRGGPDLRAYLGVKWEFGAPWKTRKEPQ